MLHALFREMETNNVFFWYKMLNFSGQKSGRFFMFIMWKNVERKKTGFATSITKAGENRKNINSDDLEKSYTC